MQDARFEIEIKPIFVPPITEGFIFIAKWKGVISMSGFDPDYYGAERRAQRHINRWKQQEDNSQ